MSSSRRCSRALSRCGCARRVCERGTARAQVGHVPKGPERVDFLYEQQQPKASEYLMGKPVELKPEDSDVKKARGDAGGDARGAV